jgi:hypothetical protein
MKTNENVRLRYLTTNWPSFLKTASVIFIFLVVGSCDKEDTPIDISSIVHGWEVVSFTASETGISQNATDAYLVEFTNDKNYIIDFDRGPCSGKFSIAGNGVIGIEPLSFDLCNSVTTDAKDLQKLLLSSATYSISGDSILTLSGTGEIKLKRSLDCANAGCQLNIEYILMTIKRPDGSDVLLTSTKLVRLSDNEVFYMESNNSVTGSYVLIWDAYKYKKELRGKKVEVEFQGFINDTMIVRRTFTITADCCHVALVSGNVDIVVD